MSDYTDAPACRILAIRCCACNTPFLDEPCTSVTPFVIPAAGVPAATSHAGWLEAARGIAGVNQANEDRELAAMDALADKEGTMRDEIAKAIARGLLTM